MISDLSDISRFCGKFQFLAISTKSLLHVQKGVDAAEALRSVWSYLNFLLHLIIVFNHSTLGWFRIIIAIWSEKKIIMVIQNVNPKKIILQYLCPSRCFSLISAAISAKNRELYGFHAEMCMESFSILLKKKKKLCGFKKIQLYPVIQKTGRWKLPPDDLTHSETEQE